MKKVIVFIALFGASIFLQSQQQSGTAGFNSNACKQLPAFTQNLGFNLQYAAFSTTEPKTKGLVFMEYNNSPNRKVYQHPSWKTIGTMGAIVTSELGVVYSAPLPSINTLENIPDKQNIIYRVEPANAEMKPFIELPKVRKANQQNSYGVMAMDYDCDTKIIYASSVFGSDMKTEVGKIYSITIDEKSGKVKDMLNNIDAFAVCVGVLNGEKRLFFAHARNSNIYSISLTQEGKFVGKPRLELSLDDIGPRGDDRARKMRFVNGDLIINGVEFFFNLIAPGEKQETQYSFRYNESEAKWVLVDMK